MAQSNSRKAVVITGGASGIGYETAKHLLATGQYRLILLGRDKDKLQSAAMQLSKETKESQDFVTPIACDLKDPHDIEKAAEKILALRSGLYGLVNNAGIYPFGGLANTTEAAWDETFMVNLKAPFLLTQALAPLLAKSTEGSRIVNVSSTAGILPNHFALAYSVSKAALIQMTRTLAKELGKDGITVNCVCPGIVRTPMHDAYHHNQTEVDTFYAKRGATFPLGRVGEPHEIAGAITYFLSPEAAWVTGDIFVMDGGRLLL